MSRGYSAIEQVMGRLLDRDPPKSGGSLRGLRPGSRGGRFSNGSGPSISRMSRVGARHGQAIFKLVRTGGVDSRSGLKGQLDYIFRDDKVAEVIDPSGIVMPHDEPNGRQINRLVDSLSDNWWAKTRNGQTSHMILSFPNGTSIKDVAGIVRDVCNEKFESGDVRYKYVAAIHDDQEHHPHAHIVLNRRGSDNSLFNMRRGTDHSYEGFREAMAVHAERRGIMLDPTSRFERGITDRQPTQTEQWNASREGRAPQQRPRTGADLEYAQEQISLARIGYEAMAVIAANADCQRLERAYTDVANMLMSTKGDYEMPALSADELEKFDQYSSLLNDALAKSQEVLRTKDATDRVPYEKQLTANMAAFTALNPDAAYAKGLHEDPSGKSIYMHQAEGDEATWSRAAERIEEYTQGTGLDAQAITARLQAGAGNLYLEQMWMQDDLRQVAKASDLSLSDPVQRQQAISELANAYQEIREDLQAHYDIRPIPQFEPDYLDANGRPTVTAAERASLENQFSRTDFNYGYADDASARNSGREQVEAARTRFAEFAQQSRNHAVFASALWDKSTDIVRPPEGYLPEAERERMAPEEAAAELDRFADLKARSGDDYMLTNSAEEHQEVIRLLKENTTDAQYDRFRRGDLSAIDHITDDKVFSRQLLMQAEMNNRSTGFEMSDETERLMSDSRDYLKDTFEADRNNPYENER
ncbi:MULTISPECIES: relaxase/mobilization nuclease domain-containing protein [Roseobacteraceae]|uniref:relaxase/mobilization nuclease domain-containing protein n=1 Tax=Roseobacteraceae TaxID=2854170 RepID=UPI0022C9B35F|nr:MULTISPECIES: relaxase/mobilization nuclease domain-containing protein [Roseobacteraceae]MCZ4354792.1 relaxase/mobilization nuclease domain-containing protein [Roseovarius aestuarii]